MLSLSLLFAGTRGLGLIIAAIEGSLGCRPNELTVLPLPLRFPLPWLERVPHHMCHQLPML
jgi:hypothetical protein